MLHDKYISHENNSIVTVVPNCYTVMPSETRTIIVVGLLSSIVGGLKCGNRKSKKVVLHNKSNTVGWIVHVISSVYDLIMVHDSLCNIIVWKVKVVFGGRSDLSKLNCCKIHYFPKLTREKVQYLKAVLLLCLFSKLDTVK